jgi:hypothetical protein
MASYPRTRVEGVVANSRRSAAQIPFVSPGISRARPRSLVVTAHSAPDPKGILKCDISRCMRSQPQPSPLPHRSTPQARAAHRPAVAQALPSSPTGQTLPQSPRQPRRWRRRLLPDDQLAETPGARRLASAGPPWAAYHHAGHTACNCGSTAIRYYCGSVATGGRGDSHVLFLAYPRVLRGSCRVRRFPRTCPCREAALPHAGLAGYR